ncbi:histidine--tRNA ligase [Taibaiella soli]|uniref:Histidine--tRNA ligase n=1 Tax=Taibaiella soli TaxID=1649169 RepID=A0A2W2AAP4_9BACT|nr:histidine--tRNA ligase [Taibaiella soli]PZF72351.1 histidine--tRNA ligase [Taibaiella soli]
MSKPSIPQGTRDFSPEVVRKRQYILGTLRSIFELYGFQPLETPSMENLTTLMGKYGEEGDRLIFKILNNGMHAQKDADKEKMNQEWSKIMERSYSSPVVTERALRYDLTIPFARYVVMNQNEIAFPFRRYQMQPVWRADRPQKGRYREFWQCDCDVVGSNSLVNEAELLCIYRAAFEQLKVPQITIKINSRKLLAGLAEIAGVPDQMMEMTIALDKLDKIGWDGVVKELSERGISAEGAEKIKTVIDLTGSNDEKIIALETMMQSSAIGMAGIAELKNITKYHEQLADKNWSSTVMVDISLARGLNYYTGFIVEVMCGAVKMGSIGGGGRYDDLTGLFGLKGLSGVGISFGIDRIYDVIEELNLFPDQLVTGSKVLLLNFGGDNETYALSVLQQLRQAGIAAEIYPDAAKFDKQMKYANKRGLPFVILPGDTERESNKLSLKNFVTGEQIMVSLEECINLIQNS